MRYVVGDVTLLQPILFLLSSSLFLSSYFLRSQTDNGIVNGPGLFTDDILVGSLGKSGQTSITILITVPSKLFVHGTTYLTCDKNVAFCLPLIDTGSRRFLFGNVEGPGCSNMLQELIHVALALNTSSVPDDEFGKPSFSNSFETFIDGVGLHFSKEEP
jgi:hypothetical protein